MSEHRLIKKYPNRRLYDTALSKYVTLEDIHQLLVNGNHVKVVDAKTSVDLTRSILLQIIIEQEEKGKPILSAELLERLIRFYGDSVQVFISSYLEKSLDAFTQQQSEFHRQMETFMEKTPTVVLAEIAEQNIVLWRTMQEGMSQFYRTAFIMPTVSSSENASSEKDGSINQGMDK